MISLFHVSVLLSLTYNFNDIKSRLDPTLQRTINLLSVKCSSVWLTALPIREQGFYLNKQEFRDVLCLHYGWRLPNVTDHCVCGSSFSANHAMICQHGGLTFVRHNELRDLTAGWLQEVCHDIAVEPPLQPLSGESIFPTTAIHGDDARADIHARGFWGRLQSAFLILGFFILTHQAIVIPRLHPYFKDMNLTIWRPYSCC